MKKTILIICLLIFQFSLSQPSFVLKSSNDGQESPLKTNISDIISSSENLSVVFVTLKNPVENGPDYKVSVEGIQDTFDITSTERTVKLEIDGFDFNGIKITITDGIEFTLTSMLNSLISESNSESNGTTGEEVGDEDEDLPFKTPEEIVNGLFPDLISKQRVGLMLPTSNSNTMYGGKNYVHIFLDGYGNPILRAIPQGSPEKTYVVHIVTSIPEISNPTIRYNVKQTQGGIDDVLVFRNSGKINEFNPESGQSYKYYHYELALTESNKNIVFEVYRGITDGKLLTNTKLSTQIIPIKIFHGSFDIGLISSELENPTYTFVASSDDAEMGKVKRSSQGKRGIVTAMATFYTSPVVLFEKFLFKPKDKNGNNIEFPDYKLSGRNFVSDHKIYERIYPTIGLGISEDALENIVFGFNWEAVRGASLFVGWHHGKINTFNKVGDDFSFEETVIDKERFDLNKKEAWKTDFAIGFNLDILVLINLLQKGTNQ
jgi:hypothetical protein